MNASSNAGHSQDSAAAHPRIRALSKQARRIYAYLLTHSSPHGSVAPLRVETWLPAYAVELGEIVDAGLLNVEDDDEYTTVLPRNLDESELLASGAVP